MAPSLPSSNQHRSRRPGSSRLSSSPTRRYSPYPLSREFGIPPNPPGGEYFSEKSYTTRLLSQLTGDPGHMCTQQQSATSAAQLQPLHRNRNHGNTDTLPEEHLLQPSRAIRSHYMDSNTPLVAQPVQGITTNQANFIESPDSMHDFDPIPYTRLVQRDYTRNHSAPDAGELFFDFTPLQRQVEFSHGQLWPARGHHLARIRRHNPILQEDIDMEQTYHNNVTYNTTTTRNGSSTSAAFSNTPLLQYRASQNDSTRQIFSPTFSEENDRFTYASGYLVDPREEQTQVQWNMLENHPTLARFLREQEGRAVPFQNIEGVGSFDGYCDEGEDGMYEDCQLGRRPLPEHRPRFYERSLSMTTSPNDIPSANQHLQPSRRAILSPTFGSRILSSALGVWFLGTVGIAVLGFTGIWSFLLSGEGTVTASMRRGNGEVPEMGRTERVFLLGWARYVRDLWKNIWQGVRMH